MVEKNNDEDVKYNLFFHESERFYKVSLETINTYDRKLNAVFISSTTILGFLFLGVTLIINGLGENQKLISTSPIVQNWNSSFYITIIFIAISFGIIISGMILQKIKVIDTKKMYEDNKHKSIEEVKEFIRHHIDELCNRNYETAKKLKNIYFASLITLGISLISFLFFINYTLIIIKSIIIK